MPTPKTRAGDRPVVTGRPAPLGVRTVGAAVAAVLIKERRRARVTVNFVGPIRIRRLNARWKGHDRPTDVLSFSWEHPADGLTGDIYICRAVAAREARLRRISVREELLRLVIHGTLHVLGYDHPEDETRMASSMWRRQERYLAWLS